MVPQVTDTMRESRAYWAAGEGRDFQVFVLFSRPTSQAFNCLLHRDNPHPYLHMLKKTLGAISIADTPP